MSVSVIIPYIETSDLILNTADSVKRQKKVSSGEIELLVVDVTAEQSAAEQLSSYPNVRVIARPDAQGEAQAYNIALENLNSDYAILARPGDVFGSHYFMNALKAVGSQADYDFAAPNRFCINPVYTRYKYICRTNVPLLFLDREADIRYNPNLLQMEIDGNIIKSEILKQYPADDSDRKSVV